MAKLAVLRLLGISLMVLFTFIFALVGLRWCALRQPVMETHHPLLGEDFYLMAQAGGSLEAPGNTRAAFDRAMQVNPDILLEVDLRLSKDGRWFLYSPKNLADQTNGAGIPELKDWAEMKDLKVTSEDFPNKSFPPKKLSLMTLQEALREYPDQTFVLDIRSKRVRKLGSLVSLIDEMKATKRVIAQSRFTNSVKELRELAPEWLFVLDVNSITQARVLGAIYIEPLADIWADMVIAPLFYQNHQLLTHRLLSEVQRRNKPFVLEWHRDFSKIPEWTHPFLNGLMTKRPSEAAKFVKQRLTP